jgi:2-polyprenyl-3-methyl-5-hydroxy-6-metoxy-1,4-benzoquinol methylase
VSKIIHGNIPEWYDEECIFEEAFHKDTPNDIATNKLITKILKKHKATSVLDLTCGTGSQVFWLLDQGFQVVGSDISKGMLGIAKKKAKLAKKSVKLLHGDMRDIKVGQFDAAITIFNAIGHLTKKDFAKTMRNIHANLNQSGIYIFDILNLAYVQQDDNILKMSYERLKKAGDTTLRIIQHSVLDDKGILISPTTSYSQKGKGKLTTSQSVGTLQLYTANELKTMLCKNGFQVLAQMSIDGKKFFDRKTERILTVAKKN